MLEEFEDLSEEKESGHVGSAKEVAAENFLNVALQTVSEFTDDAVDSVGDIASDGLSVIGSVIGDLLS